jgi:hypothetical protein
MSSLPVHVFKDSAASFTEALSERGIEFSRRIQLAEGPMAAGWIVDVFSALKDPAPWAALAAALVTWLKAKAGRKVIVTTKENEVIHTEGLSVADTIKVLERAKNVAVIEVPQKDYP